MFKERLNVLVDPVHSLGLISQSEYYILQVSTSKDSAPALDGQYSEQKTMRLTAATRCTMCDH